MDPRTLREERDPVKSKRRRRRHRRSSSFLPAISKRSAESSSNANKVNYLRRRQRDSDLIVDITSPLFFAATEGVTPFDQASKRNSIASDLAKLDQMQATGVFNTQAISPRKESQTSLDSLE
jgi:hypothetical protein